ncbi:ABC transporter substrate-binding protein/permease [Staphylococcus massiliensis]|uniref:ABC transporter substrate-binding protein/permease n=1 Tax=Staphylococcus massiliensis TaxID=555791 RepID=UPI003BAEF0A1|nr:ABC transporter substrate-binding protein/permease [Staphylococcus massiliensis]
MTTSRIYTKIMSVILMLLLIVSSLTSQALGKETDKTWEDIKKRGVLRVGLSADYAPYEFEKQINGKREYVGIDIEVAKRIAKDLGVELQIVNMQFDTLLGALKTGKVDLLISALTPTAERKKEVDFSIDYMEVPQKMIMKKKDKDTFKDIKDFNGKKVGAQKQSTQEELVKNELPDSDLQALARVPELILSLKTGKIDGLAIEGPVAEAYLMKNPELTFAPGEFDTKDKGTAIAMPKSSPILMAKVNTVLKDIMDKGLIDQYKEKAGKAMLDDGSFLAKYGGFLATGLKNTIIVSIIGVLAGAILGGLIALMKLSPFIPLKWLAVVYIEFIRGTPLLVQVFLVFFGTTAVLGLDISALVCGIIALIINSAAYIAEIIRAGINAVDKGQMEAARSLGLNYKQSMKAVIMPQAIKNILPALGNEFVTVIKESSIVSIIGVSEIMYNAQVIQGASFDPFTPLIITALFYFVLTFTLSRLLAYIEGRMSVSD